jgi:hypothetical protein
LAGVSDATWDYVLTRAGFRCEFGLSPIGRATVNRLKMNRRPYRQQREILRLAALSGALSWPE